MVVICILRVTYFYLAHYIDVTSVVEHNNYTRAISSENTLILHFLGRCRYAQEDGAVNVQPPDLQQNYVTITSSSMTLRAYKIMITTHYNYLESSHILGWHFILQVK